MRLSWFSGQARIFFILFASFTLAALQNVTVDDAVLTGVVVPQYLPSALNWNIGNTCSECFAKPDASQAYNGTWHDATFYAGNGFSPVIEFKFTGTALYIFFILANNVTGQSTSTYLQFLLDSVVTSNNFIHSPLPTTAYQYNVPVYVNESLGPGEHTMTIQPFDTGNNVLMLFDYLVYSMDPSSSVSPSAPVTLSTSPSTSATSPGTQGTSSKQNVGAIVGGTVGGVAALVLATAILLCYRRNSRLNAGRLPVEEGTLMDPFVSYREAVAPARSPFVKSALRTEPSTVPLQTSIPPSSITVPSSSGVSSGTNPGVNEQLELLRGEVARLRHLQDLDRNAAEVRSEAPPGYS